MKFASIMHTCTSIQDERPALTILVDDGDHDRSTIPFHYIHSEQQEVCICNNII